MNTHQVILLLCLCGLVAGQFHLRYDGLYNGNSILYDFSFLTSRATMCYTGDTIFLATQDPVNAIVGIFELTAADGYTTASERLTLPTGVVIPSVACCCQYLAYGYSESSFVYYVALVRTDNYGLYKEYRINLPFAAATAAIDLDCAQQLLRVVTSNDIFTFDISSTGVIPVAARFNPELSIGSNAADPRCIAFATIGSDEYLFVSFNERNGFNVVQLTGTYDVTEYTLVVNSVSLGVSCLTSDQNTLYFFSRSGSTSTGYLHSQTAVNLLNDPDNIITVFITTLTHLNFIQGELLNGISFCNNCAGQACLTSICTCADTNCGFCIPLDLSTCLCADQVENGCVYEDQTIAATCSVPFTRADACCVVLNPVAERRTGSDVNIAMVVSPSDIRGVVPLDITRAAKTGRWPTFILPRWQTLAANSQLRLGYRMPVQQNARGRRFGIYNSRFTRSDAIEENILCIATERSAFRNQLFTHVCVVGSTCTLTATMDNSQYRQQVRWRRTSILTGVVEDLPLTIPATTYSINNVLKIHEAVYEVFRFKRYLRTWHPIIYLYVRECAIDLFDPPACSSPCTFCINGICDARTGECRCYPGFVGTNCQNSCATPNLIGQTCEIDCNAIFPGADGDNCINLEICNGDDLGCQCRSGLQLPACNTACPPGRWGNNCAGTCACSIIQTCDARVGCI